MHLITVLCMKVVPVVMRIFITDAADEIVKPLISWLKVAQLSFKKIELLIAANLYQYCKRQNNLPKTQLMNKKLLSSSTKIFCEENFSQQAKKCYTQRFNIWVLHCWHLSSFIAVLSEEQEINQVISTFLRKELIYKKNNQNITISKLLYLNEKFWGLQIPIIKGEVAQTQGALRVKVT